MTNDTLEMGDMLETQYKSLESTPKQDKVVSDPNLFLRTENAQTLNDITFIPDQCKRYRKVMLEASSTAAPGPDYFPSVLLNK